MMSQGNPFWVVPLALLFGVIAVLSGAAVAVSTIAESEEAPQARAPIVAQAVPVTATHQGRGPASNSPLLAVDPTEPRFVVMANRLDAPDFDCALQVSGDGGVGWLTANPVPELPSGAEKCYAPEVVFDQSGKLYYLFVGLAGVGNKPMGAFLTTSTDHALTFSTPRQVLGPLNFSVRMAIDPAIGQQGRIHLAWLHATSDPSLGGFGPPPNPIMAAHSDDGGESFSKPAQVSGLTPRRVVAPALAVDPEGSVHVAYYDLGDDARDYQGLEGPTWEGSWSLVVASSTDKGRSFAAPVVVDDQVVPAERVMLVFTMPPPALVAGRNGPCIAWTDARHGDADVLLRCSSDDGRTWSEVRRLNDDPLGNGLRQHLPRLALSPEGRLDAIFYDRRHNLENLGDDVFYTYSIDEGRSFETNIRLTEYPSDSRIGQRYVNVAARGQVEFGSRLGLIALDMGVLAAWTDTHNSKPLTTGQDLFATTIGFFQEDDHEQAAQLIGAGLIALGTLSVALGARGLRRRQDPRVPSG